MNDARIRLNNISSHREISLAVLPGGEISLRIWRPESESFTLRLRVSQSVCLGTEPTLWTFDQILLPFREFGSGICCPVSVGRPLWREAGSVLCKSHSSQLSVCTFTIYILSLTTYHINIYISILLQCIFQWLLQFIFPSACSFTVLVSTVSLHVSAYMAIFMYIEFFILIYFKDSASLLFFCLFFTWSHSACFHLCCGLNMRYYYLLFMLFLALLYVCVLLVFFLCVL
jgi:hypothetical protein